MVKRSIFVTLLFLCLLIPRAAAAGPALLIDAVTGKVLYAENADDQWHPASLTKIMTAYLAFEALSSGKLKMDDKIVCSVLAHREPPSKIGLPIGAKISVQLGLKALIIKSANDVAIMFAEAISGTHDAFVKKMNATARRLGMSRTHFDNPNGLPSKRQITTARDLAILSQAILRDFPQYAELWNTKSFKIGRRRLRSYNGLLKTFEGADGMKTGFICDSGYNIVATATRDGHKLLAVVLGAVSLNSRRNRAATLLEHGFRTYDWKLFFNTENISTMPIDRTARGPISIRKIVRNRVCGYRGFKRKRRRRNAKVVARTKARNARLRRARKAKLKKTGLRKVGQKNSKKSKPAKKPTVTVKAAKPKKS